MVVYTFWSVPLQGPFSCSASLHNKKVIRANIRGLTVSKANISQTVKPNDVLFNDSSVIARYFLEVKASQDSLLPTFLPDVGQ